MTCAVIFGGTGFIGVYFAKMLLDEKGFDKVYLFDNEGLSRKASEFRKKLAGSDARISVVEGDVRQYVEWIPAEPVDLIANFAAIHREPGHEDFEYYQTNILGAENVCHWANRVKCESIIFSSSISPYGASEAQKSEDTLPVPTSAYGGSKLVAEKIHLVWQAASSLNRQLVIVRPGVVFGPGEGGNVSRLIKAVLGRYFFYMGNRKTRKAGIYVKELCHAMYWVLETQRSRSEGVSLFNMTMNPGPSIEEYVQAVCTVAGIKRSIPQVPYKALLVVAGIIDIFAKPLGIKHPFSPVRIKKLVRSNDIVPNYLTDKGYQYKYGLVTAFQDWRACCPEEWK